MRRPGALVAIIEAGLSLLVEARHILAPGGNNPQEIVELAHLAPRHPVKTSRSPPMARCERNGFQQDFRGRPEFAVALLKPLFHKRSLL